LFTKRKKEFMLEFIITTRVMNTLHHMRSQSKDWKTN
jgi:hypothetical protein